MSQNWAAQELSGIDLGDARLNKRSVMLLDWLADKPTASIPTACNGWAQAQAAYRFLAQEINAPDGVKPIVWRLLSNRCAASLGNRIIL